MQLASEINAICFTAVNNQNIRQIEKKLGAYAQMLCAELLFIIKYALLFITNL